MSSSVKLTLLAVDALPAEVTARLTSSAQAILTVLRLHHRPMGTGELADLAGVTRMTATRALAALEQEGIVTWRGNSKRDPRATWALGQLPLTRRGPAPPRGGRRRRPPAPRG